jgi:hypothetical protein
VRIELEVQSAETLILAQERERRAAKKFNDRFGEPSLSLSLSHTHSDFRSPSMLPTRSARHRVRLAHDR